MTLVLCTQVNDYENGVCPEWIRVERVVAAKGGDGTRDTVNKYLVKWEVLGYQDCTWEPAEELTNDEVCPCECMCRSDQVWHTREHSRCTA